MTAPVGFDPGALLRTPSSLPDDPDVIVEALLEQPAKDLLFLTLRDPEGGLVAWLSLRPDFLDAFMQRYADARALTRGAA